MTNIDYLDRKTGKGPFGYNPEKEKPNILFISMDMVPREFHRIGSSLNIPNQRSLMEEGINCTRAFSSSPLCGPSRASFLTGRYTYITGNSERSHDGHATELKPDDIIWPQYLKALGYHTRHIGKSHVGTEHFIKAFSENSSPWDRWSPPWYDEDAYIQFLHDRGLERFTFKKEIRGQTWEGLREGNSYGGWLADQNGKTFPEEALYSSFLVEKAISTLNGRPDEKTPFYLQLDFFGPHQPFAIPGGWEEREAEIRKEMDLPESWIEWEAAGFPSKTEDPRVYDLYRKNWGLKNRQDALDYRVANQLQYEVLDKHIGRVFDYLKEKKIYDNTWIFFISDHGEMNGRKGCIDKGAYLNPQVLHVPLVLKPPKNFKVSVGEILETPCSLLDIFPTICEITGLEVTERTDGVSILSTLRNRSRPVEKPIMFDVWNHVAVNPSVGRLFEDNGEIYLFSYNCTSDIDELYWIDEKEDLENLIAIKPELKKTALKKMHEALSSDERWDVYRCHFELEYGEILALKMGESQKFE